MTAFSWPAWVSWLMLVAVILTLANVWILLRSVTLVRYTLAGGTLEPARNRRELEERYAAGVINRDVYERWKDRLK